MKTTHAMKFLEADGSPGGAPAAPAEPAATSTPAGDPPSLIAQPATPPATESFVNPDGTFSDGWTGKLPDDLKDAAPTLGKYKTVTDLAKALHNANGLIGKKTLVPTDKSTPEEVAAYRQALGIPETVDAYDIKPAEIPEGLGWNEENAKRYAELGHKHNIPPTAMKAIVAEYANQRIAEMQLMAQEVDNRRQFGIDDLKKTWGENFSKNLGLAGQAAKAAGANPESFGFGDPEVVKAFVRLASQLSDDSLVKGSGALQGGADRAKDIMTNKANPLYDRYHTGDEDTVQMVRNYLTQG